LTTAYYLANDGVRVLLLDCGDLGRQASWAGAGIVPPGNSKRASTPYDLLRAHSSEMYPALSRQLHERCGLDNGYVVCGGVEVVETPDATAVAAWRDEGIVFEEWNTRILSERLPHIGASISRAYYVPQMAQVRNPRHLQALIACCQLAGVQFQTNCAMRGFVRDGDRIGSVETDAGRLPASRYLLAAGAWSGGLLEQVGWQPGIRPVRGQMALLKTTTALGPILLHGKRYIVPRLDGHVLVGSTEEEADFDARPTASAIAELLAFATELAPPLADASVERCWAGLRPGSPDGLPFLGLVPGWRNLFVAAGHFRSGIQLSPATGMVMKQLLMGATPTIPLETFRLDRPTSTPSKTAFRS
jgi:glycine oxidase